MKVIVEQGRGRQVVANVLASDEQLASRVQVVPDGSLGCAGAQISERWHRPDRNGVVGVLIEGLGINRASHGRVPDVVAASQCVQGCRVVGGEPVSVTSVRIEYQKNVCGANQRSKYLEFRWWDGSDHDVAVAVGQAHLVLDRRVGSQGADLRAIPPIPGQVVSVSPVIVHLTIWLAGGIGRPD